MSAATPELIERLARYDTPTICNALETLDADRRGTGFTTRPLMAAFPAMGPVVGVARTLEIRTTAPRGEDRESLTERRLDYFGYVATGRLPKIVVARDLDGDAGIAASWGDVMATLHRAFGVRGVVTDGAIRDIAGMPEGIQFLAAGEKPSHGYLHTIAFGRRVEVAGMAVGSDDLVHMDRNGAVMIPANLAEALPAACDAVQTKERQTLDTITAPHFDIGKARELFGGR